jgi:hypothetical protein
VSNSTREDRSLERLAALLAMAEGSTNEAERAAFMDKAQRLATLHSIGLANARAHAQNKNKTANPISRTITIGPKGKKGLANYVILMDEIARANDVMITIAHNSTYVNLYGFEEDIEVTERLYGSVLHQMVAASEKYLATGQYKAETDWRQVRRYDPAMDFYYMDWDETPIPKQTARTNFQQEYANRIGSRLQTAKTQVEKEAEQQQEATTPLPAGTPGVALVLAGKKKSVKEYYDRTNNASGSWRGDSRNTAYSESARDAGKTAADRAHLNNPNTIGGARGEIGR